MFKNHNEALDYLVQHLWEIDEHPSALSFIEKEPMNYAGRNPRRAVPMCDLVLMYLPDTLHTCTLVELKHSRHGTKHGKNQLFSGRQYVNHKYGITNPALKLVYYDNGKIRYTDIK